MAKSSQAGPIISGTMAGLEESILCFGKKHSYPANHILLHSGEDIQYLYYILSGEILISSYTSPESVSHLFILREKSMLGLIGMFTANKSLAAWRTLTKCTCHVFNKEDLYSLAPREMLLGMLEQMATMSSSMTRRFAQGTSKRLDVRLARLLIHMLDACECKTVRDSGAKILDPCITQEMASELLSMHPVTFNRILAAMRAQGLIGRFTKNRLEIFNLAVLEKVADGEMPPLEY